MKLSRILIGVNSSAFALHAAKVGFEIASALNAEVALLFVIDRAKESVSVEYGPTPKQSQMILLREAQETLDQIEKMYGQGKQLYRFTPEGFLHEEVLNMAKEWCADLIVIGTHARKGIAQLFSSNIVMDIIKHATVPVIVVPPGMP